jgi:hypothetical protein
MQDDDPVYAPLIRQAVNRELARKGYQEVEEGGQLEVIAAGVSSKSSQLEGYLMMFGSDYFDGFYSSTAVRPVTRVNREGTLAVTLYDPALKAGVWSGYIQEVLARSDPGKKISAGAGKLLKKLPKRKL